MSAHGRVSICMCKMPCRTLADLIESVCGCMIVGVHGSARACSCTHVFGHVVRFCNHGPCMCVGVGVGVHRIVRAVQSGCMCFGMCM